MPKKNKNTDVIIHGVKYVPVSDAMLWVQLEDFPNYFLNSAGEIYRMKIMHGVTITGENKKSADITYNKYRKHVSVSKLRKKYFGIE